MPKVKTGAIAPALLEALRLKIEYRLNSIRLNHRSQSVAKRLGAQTDGARVDHEPDAEVWIHLPKPI